MTFEGVQLQGAHNIMEKFNVIRVNFRLLIMKLTNHFTFTESDVPENSAHHY